MLPPPRWLSKRRLRRHETLRRQRLNSCPVCLHHWSEHAAGGNDSDGVCGECAYEIEHGHTSLGSIVRCTLRGPDDLVAHYPSSAEPHVWQTSVCPCHPIDCGHIVMRDGAADTCDLPPDADIHAVGT